MPLDLLGPASAVGAVTARPGESRRFGQTDTWFAPCTNQALRDGTQIQAVFFNGLLAQLRYALRASGIDLDNDDPAMLWKAILAATPPGSLVHRGVNAGSANALVAELTPTAEAYVVGAIYVVDLSAPNTAEGSANLGGLGLRNVVRSNGRPLRAGDMSRVAVLTFDGADLVLLNLSQEIAPPGSAFARGLDRFGFTPAQNVTSTLQATFDITYAGVVTGISILNSSPGNGNVLNTMTISVNGIEAQGARDTISGGSSSYANVDVRPGDRVVVTSRVTPADAPPFGMSQYLRYQFVPG